MTSEEKTQIVDEIIQEMKKEKVPVVVANGVVQSVPTSIAVCVTLTED